MKTKSNWYYRDMFYYCACFALEQQKKFEFELVYRNAILREKMYWKKAKRAHTTKFIINSSEKAAKK
jgi:hypothetical protein